MHAKSGEVILPLESDPKRKQVEIEELLSRLAVDTRGRDQIARVTWLVDHVADYLDRWVGVMPFFAMHNYIHNDLHIILVIGIDLVDREIAALDGWDALKANWRPFATAVRNITADTDKSIAHELLQSFQNVRNIMVATERT